MVDQKTKVFVLGLDGASWNVLKPLIEKGKLPTFKKLIESGSYGKLESITPPISVPAWKCYSTGRDPSKLGVYSFLMLDLENYTYKVAKSTDFRGLDIWDVLGEYGKISVVYKMFSTYPAKKIKGCIVSEYPEMENGIYPKELREELKEKFGSIFTDIAFTTDRVDTYAKVVEEMKKDFKVIKYLVDKYNPDFVHFTVAHTDGIQHFFWRDMLNGKSRYADYIEKAWIVIDKLVGELLNYLNKRNGEKWYLLIISDHGFTEVKYRFNIANWLIKRGYLKLTPKGKLLRMISRFLTLERAYSLVESVIKFSNSVLKIKKIKWGVQHNLAANISEQVIDFDRSTVIPLEGQILYLNNKNFKSRSGREAFVKKLIKELSEIKRPDGEPLFRAIYDGKKFYSNDSAPDILLVANEVYLYTMPLINELWAIPPENKWTGMHDLYGVFIACGEEISGNNKINARIVDIFPTILHIFGIPIPKGISGKVLEEIFKEGSRYRLVSPEYVEDQERLVLRHKIRSLRHKLKLLEEGT